MSKKTLSESTLIEIGKGVSLSAFIEYFEKTTDKRMPGCEFTVWLSTQSGKTLGDAIEPYIRATERLLMEKLLSQERFAIISEPDKAFIIAFDRALERLGYAFGGGIGDGYCWGKYMIVYSKVGVKSKKVAARIFIRDSGIVLRLFLNNVDRHRTFIEGSPEHIKSVFIGAHGACSCKPRKENCRMRKSYLIDGELYEKCSGSVFEFHSPNLEKLPDYIALLAEFYPPKKSAAKNK